MNPASPASPSALTRRRFLQPSAVAAGGLAFLAIIPPAARAAAGTGPPSARTPIGRIGKGGRADRHLEFPAHPADAALVAGSDADRRRREEGRAETAEINAGKKSVGTSQSCAGVHGCRAILARPDSDAAKAGKDSGCDVGQFGRDGRLGQVKSAGPSANHPSPHLRSALQSRRRRRGGRPRRCLPRLRRAPRRRSSNSSPHPPGRNPSATPPPPH